MNNNYLKKKKKKSHVKRKILLLNMLLLKSLNCNQIKFFINLEIIREEDKYPKKKFYSIYFFKIIKKFCKKD